MYKMLYVVSTLQHTGPTNQLFNLVRYLNDEKFHAEILTLSPEPDNSLKKSFIELGIDVYSLGLTRINGILKSKSKLIDFINLMKPNLLHSHGIRADNLISRIRLDIPSLATIRTSPDKDYKNKYGFIIGSIMARYHYYAINHLDKAVTCSKELSYRFKSTKGIHIDYIQNGVDHILYQKVSLEEKRNIRKKFGFGENSRIFICVGPLDSGKDIATIIKAFAQKTKSDNILFLIIGDGPEKEWLQKLATGNDNVRFVGRTQNVLECYRCADFLISASRYEGLPNAILEAMSCGLPVILSNIGPHKEILNSINDYPYIFKTKDYMQLNDQINDIMNEDYKELSNKMRYIITKNFTAEIMSKTYQSLYLDLINNYRLTNS